MVHYNGVTNTWHCRCTKARKSCPHKAIAKCHLYQLKPEIFKNLESCHEEPPETFSVQTHPTVDTEEENISLYPPEGTPLVEMVEYLISHKALPRNLPRDLTLAKSSSDMPRNLVPCENYCHKCPGKVPLSEPIVISKQAKIVTITEVVEGVTTYCKQCAACGTFYRYQEWSQGLHNRIILTHHFCLFLRNSIQSHTAVARVVEALQKTNSQKYPDPALILHGYLHFEALSSHTYEFSCVNCGDHPLLLLWICTRRVYSVCQKCYSVLQLALMCDIQEPPPEFDGQVDVDDFWLSVSVAN
ncbi:hypothetical protein N1851_006686 [Merluccius polli]|uniref:HMG domain-containing protein n=1 Tax=Merluccius polli TaxID=89951 RepID=A0AA47N5F3_MERPO|nr:hypothetical protein N1851_006686 [Merluccius polli]